MGCAKLKSLNNTAVFFLLVVAGQVVAGEWIPVSGVERLEQLIGGATAVFEYQPGELATGTYRKDGAASIAVMSTTFERTWKIKGDDQVCYLSAVNHESNCYRMEQNSSEAERFRAVHVDKPIVYDFRVVDNETRLLAIEILAGSGSFSSPSAAEIAAELANPNTALGTLNFFLDYTQFQGDTPGADSAGATKLTFQPGMPYPLSKSANFFFRPLFPVIIKQDVAGAGAGADGFEEKTFELGDISFDMSVFNSSSFGLIYGGGLAGAIPTATDESLGGDQWLQGPEVILALMKGWGVVGIIASHQWDVGGNSEPDTSITGAQYFYSINVKDGWIFGANPNLSYNHEADSGNELTLPLGIGASKTMLPGGWPWKFGLRYWYYVESSDDFGPQHLLRLQVAPVIKLPW